MYLLDTNTLIYFFKGQGHVAERLLSVPPSELGISAIVLHELETGIAKSTNPEKRRHQLEALVNAAVFLPFAKAEARAAAFIRRDLEEAGTPIGTLDTLIAATAVANRAILVTHNTREFSRIPDLALDDWF
jgi:tRNA(fMet)-specific endonuclease VapC